MTSRILRTTTIQGISPTPEEWEEMTWRERERYGENATYEELIELIKRDVDR